jgi:hypothetical protein
MLVASNIVISALPLDIILTPYRLRLVLLYKYMLVCTDKVHDDNGLVCQLYATKSDGHDCPRTTVNDIIIVRMIVLSIVL